MNAGLLYPDHAGDRPPALPWQAAALIQDLDLAPLFDVMAGGDSFVRDIVVHTVLTGVSDPATIRYRQAILADCLTHPDLARALYDLAGAALDAERQNFWGQLRSEPSAILNRARDVLAEFLAVLVQLRGLAARYAGTVTSDGLRTLFAMLQRDLTDAYLVEVTGQLHGLHFPHGLVLTARLGAGNKGEAYLLRPPPEHGPPWWDHVLGAHPPAYTFSLAEQDESGMRALADLQDRGVNELANVLAQTVDQLLGFFQNLRAGLAFYRGGVALAQRLDALGLPRCVPQPRPPAARDLTITNLHDLSLALRQGRPGVGNDVQAVGIDLVLVTGANQGGKTTFLRSLGIAQLLLQCGLWVPAESFRGPVCTGLYTHFKREEDATLRSGKFDEELSRMSAVADHLQPHALVLFNESFAATNEREGSAIAHEIVQALLDRSIRVCFVTHLYELAQRFYAQAPPNALFLRAPRPADSPHPFHLLAGAPQPTSYGADVYDRIFGPLGPRPAGPPAAAPAPAAPAT